MAKVLWTQRQDIGPAVSIACVMAFDPVRGKTVLFDGADTNGGTWEWDGQYWTQVSDMGPSPRRDFGMAWDNTSQAVLLFGGSGPDANGDSGRTGLGDTWEWNGENWTQVEDTGPAARFALAVSSDTARSRVVLFGGANFVGGTPQALGETWEWDGTAWTQVDETGPFARSGHRMTFDSARSRTVLFGGIAIDGTGQRDTWEWNGTTWVRVSEFGPAPRIGAGFCFDGAQSVLFGGRDLTPLYFGDTWSWDGRFWTQRQDIGPQARAGHAMACDATRRRTVLFGGSDVAGNNLNDTWELA